MYDFHEVTLKCFALVTRRTEVSTSIIVKFLVHLRTIFNQYGLVYRRVASFMGPILFILHIDEISSNM